MANLNYSNGKIYKIVDNTNGNIYIGSTCKTLSQRLEKHRINYKQYLDGKYGYTTSFEILKNSNCDIYLLEKCENIASKEELRARERHYIGKIECVNKRVEGRTQKEYYNDNIEKMREYEKEYYIKNKDKIREKHKEYVKINQDEIKEYKKEYYKENIEKIREKQNKYMKQHCDEIKEYQKEYRKTHKEKKSKIDKDYYELNKEKISNSRKIKIHCDICDCEVVKYLFKRHERTLKHQNNLIN